MPPGPAYSAPALAWRAEGARPSGGLALGLWTVSASCEGHDRRGELGLDITGEARLGLEDGGFCGDGV